MVLSRSLRSTEYFPFHQCFRELRDLEVFQANKKCKLFRIFKGVIERLIQMMEISSGWILQFQDLLNDGLFI